ncbi:DinB family protein [Cohnella sp. CFH 77786]|uniref:DinB family protein n=1 Tax=Cohnella sp. CFH 77786 TaxID=2662265 RepID=UPI001C60DE26|nr:DinB family protein [Cohnella sp. CFH 77786]MBW5447061.1 DinB family protein [Cohnella sp. CFH 77786]
MNRIELLVQGWEFCYDKEDWYPPLQDALKGVSASQAAWKPEGSAVNSIWENVNHLLFYKERLLARWTGEETAYPEGVTNDDTFAVPSAEEADWQETLARLERVHRGIGEKLAALSEEELDEAIPGRKLEGWAHSLIRHDAYHTGQIVMLCKLQGTWPARRAFE